MKNVPVLLTSVLICILATPASLRAQWTTQLYGPHAEAALLDASDVQESSGLVASRTSPDVYWTHNDSGGTPHIWAVRLNAADMAAHTAHKLGYVYLPSATNVDWEDIAAGPGPRIYVFDGGDNPACDRTNKRIHRFLEPTIDPDGPAVALTPSFDSIRFEYPDSSNAALPADSNDERYDCETLMVHPTTGDIYLLTKRTNANVGTARVYKLPAASITWNSANIYVLQFVADISSVVTGTATGGDIDPFGRRAVVRNYSTAYEFTLPQGQPFDTIFSQTPRLISLSGALQGEGICFASDGGNIFTSSEVLPIGPTTCPFYIVPWQLANLGITAIGPDYATLHWETAAPAASTVDYGPTTAYGSTTSNAAAVCAHDLQLTSLLPNQRYYYRVTSGTLAFPQAAQAAQVFFTTLRERPGDIDQDGDVDQSDFGFFQQCLTGLDVPQTSAACQSSKLDPDSDVDDTDVAIFTRCISGPNVAADSHCTE